jgi:hypothetical protein
MMFQGKTAGDVGLISGLWNLVNLWIAVISTDVWRYMWRDTSFKRFWHSEYIAKYSATEKNAKPNDLQLQWVMYIYIHTYVCVCVFLWPDSCDFSLARFMWLALLCPDMAV